MRLFLRVWVWKSSTCCCSLPQQGPTYAGQLRKAHATSPGFTAQMSKGLCSCTVCPGDWICCMYSSHLPLASRTSQARAQQAREHQWVVPRVHPQGGEGTWAL